MTTKIAGNSGSTNVQKSTIPGAIAISQEEHYFIKEMAFTQSQRFTFGLNEVRWFLIDPTNYVPDVEQLFNRIIFQVPSVSASAGPVLIDFYSAPTLGAAVATPLAYPAFNRIASSSRVAQLEFSSLNVAPSSLGTPLSQLLIPSSGAGVGNKLGSAITDRLPFGLGVVTPLLLVVTNTDGAGALINIRHSWLEI